MNPICFSLLLALFALAPSSPTSDFSARESHWMPADTLPSYTCEDLLNEAQDGSAEPLQLAQNEDSPAFNIELSSPQRPIIVTLTVEQDSFCVDNTNRAIALWLKKGKQKEMFSLLNQGPDNCEGKYVFKFGTGRSLDQTLKKLREKDIITIFIPTQGGMMSQDISPEQRKKLRTMLECL